jgi:hypothetical protein
MPLVAECGGEKRGFHVRKSDADYLCVKL